MSSFPNMAPAHLKHLFVWILIVALILPMVVLAQDSDADVFTEIGTIDTEETDVIVIEAEGDSTSIATDSTTPVSGSNLPIDNYRREQLPTGTVFNDFVIGPGRFEVELAPGESRTVELLVSNRMGMGRIFTFSVEDMQASDRSDGSVQLLGEREGPYTLRDFISIPHEQFYLEHGTRVRVPVTISLPPDAEPGGRYGSLLTSIVSDPVDRGGDGTRAGSAIISRVGTLFFVTTPGGIVRDSALTDFSTLNRQSYFGSGPVTFLIEMSNYGSVHTTPSGFVSITNLIGEEVGAVEMPSWFVLPGAVRTREVEWNRELLIGRYTATVQVNRGHDDLTDEMSFSFWVIPWKLMLVVFAGLFVFFLILRFIFSRFEFKRKS